MLGLKLNHVCNIGYRWRRAGEGDEGGQVYAMCSLGSRQAQGTKHDPLLHGQPTAKYANWAGFKGWVLVLSRAFDHVDSLSIISEIMQSWNLFRLSISGFQISAFRFLFSTYT